MTVFENKILALVKKIPKGKISTYKIIAIKLGNKNLARAIGNALSKNPHLFKIPCHRIVKSNGELGGYKLGLAKKKKILQDEGIKVKGNKIVNFKSYIYKFN